MSELENSLSVLNDCNLVVAGDMNIDILNSFNSFNPNIINYKQLISCFGLESYIDSPTRVTSVSETCIDHVLIRFSRSIKFNVNTCMEDTGITDHNFTIGFNLSFGLSFGRAGSADVPVSAGFSRRVNFPS